ncbi:MAG: phosphoenolpyruvate synthase [Litorilinea sp.]|nr:MAG: phosphoenolpyruvate synthase [Litorilinea sp.]
MKPTFVFDACSPESLPELSGKARGLALAGGAGLPVPPWYFVAPSALLAALSPEQQDALARATDAGAAQAALAHLRLPPALLTELAAASADLAGDGSLLAVRSSAPDEDSRGHSFAGQLCSFLNVPPDQVPQRLVEVWRSGFSERVFAYRREHGLPLPPPPPGVIIQRMVEARVSGVAFSADPVSGRRSVAVVAAVQGLAEGLVAGHEQGDTYRVQADGTVLERHLQHEDAPLLTDAEIRAVAALARRAAAIFSRPQDIEWALAGDGQLYLLQSRPITGLADLPDPDAPPVLWDNSNIIESYGGMTTPLTYSFARRAYEEVYQQFCRILYVPEGVIQANRHVFAAMIGLIRGRIYYNLLNWYRVLALLPGFRANRHFMEQMMGVKESLPDSLVAELDQSTWRQRWLDRLYLLRTSLGLVLNFLLLERRKRAFYRRLADALGQGRPDLTALRADELVAYYQRLERLLLTRWDAPLLNDFFAMIFYGVLGRLTAAWCGDTTGSLRNDLLSGSGGMISAEPAERVRELARLALDAQAADPGFVRRLQAGTRAEIEASLPHAPAFQRAYRAYLEEFGERCRSELKLESPTLHDDPLPLLRAVGQLAALGQPGLEAPERTGTRDQAERQALAGIGQSFWRRWLFRWVLQQTRRRVRDRENLRFARTRVFGRARQIFRELGKRLYEVDALDDPADVFYLEVDEIFGFVDGTTTCADLRGLVSVRRAEFARYAAMEAPAERFVTRGMVHRGNRFQADSREEQPGPAAGSMQGLGCCPGVVRGRVRVVRDPLTAGLEPGDIVAAEHTDPGWILILPMAAGLLVERGSLLSHAAIVARELGIPAVVGLRGLTAWLADGDWVELDGGTGVVRRLPRDGGQ